MNLQLRNGLPPTVSAVAMLYLAGAPFGGNDKPFYANAAIGWFEQPPTIGQNHWSLRPR